MILIIGNNDDIHIQSVVEHLDNTSLDYRIVSSKDYGITLFVSVKIHEGNSTTILQINDEFFTEEEISAVWYRRYSGINKGFHEDVAKDEYIIGERKELFESLEYLLPKAQWLSKPSKIKEAEKKLYNLLLANKIGFTVPNSVIGDLPELVYELSKKHNPIAIKPLNKKHLSLADSDKAQMLFTQLANQEELLQRIHQVKSCPTIFQNYIPKKYEVRVTIVGNQIFAAKIDSQNAPEVTNDYIKIDWRASNLRAAPHSTIEIPPEIKQKCLTLMKLMDISYGAFDFVVTPSDEYVYLEVNAGGQWLWIEQLTGMPVSKAIADFLIGAGNLLR